MSLLEISETENVGERRWGVSLIDDNGVPVLRNITQLPKGVALSTAKTLKHKGPAAPFGEDESEDHRGQGEQHRDETGRETRVEAEPDHRQNDHANRQPQRELQRSYRGSDSNGAESHAKRRFPDSLGVGDLALDP